MVAKKAPRRLHNQFRVIGGQWRGRKFNFASLEQLRPTPNRVRETLFNWVQHRIEGWRCLDLYAGSGALGFEALSRGAAEVVFVDVQPRAVQSIMANLAQVSVEPARAICADAATFIRDSQIMPVDLVFLDPPFHQGLLEQCCEWLEAHHLVREQGYIYIETEQPIDRNTYPESWVIQRSQKAGQVYYYLLRKER